MKTYVAGYTTGIVGGKSTGAGWLVEFTYNASSTLYFASYDCNLSGAGPAVGCLSAVTGLTSSIDPYSADWAHGRVSVTLIDSKISGYALDGITNKTLAGLMRQKQFLSRAVRIWRINSGMTTVTGHDVEFTGYVSDLSQSVDGSTFTFICDAWFEKSSKILPQTVVTETDYPLAPKESFGQRLPIVYGTFEHEQDSSTYERDFLINNFHYVPSVCIDASIGKFVFAGHAVNALANTDIALFDSNLGTYLTGIYAYTGGTTRPTVATTNPANVTLTSPTNLQTWTADAIYLIPTAKGGKDDGKTTNRQYLHNQALSDGYATLTSTAINQFCVQRFISLGGDIEFIKAAAASDAVLWLYITSTTGSPTFRLEIWNGITGAGDEGGSSSGTGWFSVNFGNFADRSETDGTAIATTAQWTIKELTRYEYGIKIETSGDVIDMQALAIELKRPILGASVDAFVSSKVYSTPFRRGIDRMDRPHDVRPGRRNRYQHDNFAEKHAAVQETIFANSAIFAEIKGRQFGSWIDDIARSNTKNVNNLITESNFQIESILRDELGFGNSSIEVADFDAAESGRTNTHFSINQEIDAYRVIRELSQCTTSITFPSSGGKWKHYILPQDPEGDATYDMAVDWGDIRPRSFYMTGQDQLCNKVTVRYHFDYGKSKFMKEAIVTNSTSQGTGARGYNHTYEKTISVPYFRFDSSSGATNWASDFATLFVSHWANPHAMFEFEMLNHSNFTLEEGDVVKFTNFERNVGAIGGGPAGDYWSAFFDHETIYWLIVGRSAENLDSITYTAFNLHQLV